MMSAFSGDTHNTSTGVRVWERGGLDGSFGILQPSALRHRELGVKTTVPFPKIGNGFTPCIQNSVKFPF